ncbi:MAG: hypothetical protein COZ06_07975 [Armatimonadetes bacterium CG_4_10_14_3_um_filter_66_18]|nr:MAG: hypothetical protein COS65_18460 [Armatimonadetes bacterium CG06_land_8_20_14_3_00_66_21]PIX46518.1 MAG: hypothetical protein COZ57_11635 [Armatimonadetes bacterium CG_4_8_14_3_um_filter_66_20]PIY50703.1 MAG: hypothetical protein COZ06_07975 [Armatimonadetes bacterium CG_4_10_14_3_um_filter_66_18]PIZ43989.1 MAG: hypothetical protein COY42_14920 [Armatimonadetes bacterium CG_4_10_14_0_8_um_filter_66_14]PJB69145.1 MAG: hypothetical protein CO096_13570 [Armatimonadetes bacterium CG_4_9_14_
MNSRNDEDLRVEPPEEVSMPDNEFKVAVVGCSGIGRLISTVVRQAVYMIERDRPDQVAVVSSGALTGNVEEALDTCRRYPLVLIDGCRPRCATTLANGKDLPVAGVVYAADVIAKGKLSLSGERREELGEKGMAVARAIADEALEKIDWLIADEMVSTL